MIVDTSALVAILTGEKELESFVTAIHEAPAAAIATPTALEAGMVIGARLGQAGLARLDAFIAEAEITVLPFTAAHAVSAREAFLRYGKGRHPAGLNFGDCMAYAVAKQEKRPLLFKGNDFRHTDIEAVVVEDHS